MNWFSASGLASPLQVLDGASSVPFQLDTGTDDSGATVEFVDVKIEI